MSRQMLPEIDVFSCPEALDDAKRTAELLINQIKILETFKRTKNRLQSARPLNSHVLSKCKVFINHINTADPHSTFFLEVSRLSLNELVFSSISFDSRRLKALDSFKASYVRKYVGGGSISCRGRSEIFRRIKFLLEGCKNSQFERIYMLSSSANSPEKWLDRDTNTNANSATSHTARTSTLDPQPQTTALESTGYSLIGARWEDIKNLFGAQVANDLVDPTHENLVSTYPQFQTGGDALLDLSCKPDADFVFKLFQEDQQNTAGARVAALTEVFGSRIANAINESDLRIWERRNGHVDRTSCVTIDRISCVKTMVRLRICYDTNIANDLYKEY